MHAHLHHHTWQPRVICGSRLTICDWHRSQWWKTTAARCHCRPAAGHSTTNTKPKLTKLHRITPASGRSSRRSQWRQTAAARFRCSPAAALPLRRCQYRWRSHRAGRTGQGLWERLGARRSRPLESLGCPLPASHSLCTFFEAVRARGVKRTLFEGCDW